MRDSGKLHVIWESSAHACVLTHCRLIPEFCNSPNSTLYYPITLLLLRPSCHPGSQHCSQVSVAIPFPLLFTYHSFSSLVNFSDSILFSRLKYFLN